MSTMRDQYAQQYPLSQAAITTNKSGYLLSAPYNFCIWDDMKSWIILTVHHINMKIYAMVLYAGPIS